MIFLNVSWKRRQVKATCLPLGTGRLFTSWMSKKTRSYAGLLGEALVCARSWACAFPDAQRWRVCRGSSFRKVAVAPWECVASSEHTRSDFCCLYDILKDVKHKNGVYVLGWEGAGEPWWVLFVVCMWELHCHPCQLLKAEISLVERRISWQ